MTLENELSRIADALEAIAEKTGPALAGPPNVPVAPAGEAEQPRRRGRPSKNPSLADLAAARAAAPPAETADADLDFGGGGSFLDDPPAEPKKYVLDDVRKAVIAFGKKCQNPEKARKLLKDVGGVEVLAHLDPSKFAAVIEATEKA